MPELSYSLFEMILAVFFGIGIGYFVPKFLGKETDDQFERWSRNYE